jgi:hypothetical protein
MKRLNKPARTPSYTYYGVGIVLLSHVALTQRHLRAEPPHNLEGSMISALLGFWTYLIVLTCPKRGKRGVEKYNSKEEKTDSPR